LVFWRMDGDINDPFDEHVLTFCGSFLLYPQFRLQ
jgi:hypothetical protein